MTKGHNLALLTTLRTTKKGHNIVNDSLPHKPEGLLSKYSRNVNRGNTGIKLQYNKTVMLINVLYILVQTKYFSHIGTQFIFIHRVLYVFIRSTAIRKRTLKKNQSINGLILIHYTGVLFPTVNDNASSNMYGKQIYNIIKLFGFICTESVSGNGNRLFTCCHVMISTTLDGYEDC